MNKAEAIEILLGAVDNAARNLIDEYGVERIIELGGVDFLWKHLLNCYSEAIDPDVRQMVAIILQHERQVRQRLAGILGLA